ncbi:RTA-like protein [Fusarium oxysporum f. sp. vasinfectum]|nr:RTA-like protein [Fusarium oxysporum f. sp. vasinfectum]
MAAKCDPNYRHADWSFYRYEPSTAAAVIFVVLFSITTIVHVIQLIKTKTWYMLAFCLGGISEIAGYIGRAINSTEDPGCWTLGPYVVQSVLLLIAPALMAASIYMILSRVILLTEGEVHAVIRRRWLTKIFVVGDIISIELQSAEPSIRWRHYLTTLYITSGFIWVRSLFRVIEYLDGNDGYLMRTEAFMFVFDATLIWIVMVWMNWYYPSEIGLLLRNEIPVANGFELLPFRQRFEKIRS